jgi:hypothetical protein
LEEAELTELSERPGQNKPKRLNREEARNELPEELRAVFDKLCDETIEWSRYYYGTKMVSYSILKQLVEDGWIKRPRKNAG